MKYIKKSLKYVLIHDTWTREILWPWIAKVPSLDVEVGLPIDTTIGHRAWQISQIWQKTRQNENTTATGHLSDSACGLSPGVVSKPINVRA